MTDEERADWIVRLRAALPRRGPRVCLRPWRTADVDQCHAQSAPDAAWRALDGPYFPQPDEAQIEARRQRRHEHIAAGRTTGRGMVIVVADIVDDTFLGTVSWYWVCPHSRWPAAGIVLTDPTRWRTGLGSEALGLWVDLLFEVGDFHRLDLRTWSGNHGMMALAEKLGFREEARFREARAYRGERYDGLAYGLLRAEWTERRAAAPG